MSRAILALTCLFATAVPARAELVYFTSGRTLSVKSYAVDGGSIVLALRGGGEVVCESTLIERIVADEVPYPEPVTAVEPPPIVATAPPTVRSPLPVDARFDALIKTAAGRYGVNADLVRAVIHVESGYQPRARSKKGAVGLMQVMPATARQYGVRNLFDPRANIDVGIRHLRSLLDRFPLNLALAAYNAGQASVERYGGIPPYRETETYVARILALVGS